MNPSRARSLNTLNEITVPINPRPPNLPSGHLIEGRREDYIQFAVPLFEASSKGDWIAAKAILDGKPELVRSAITKDFDTPLHIAASAKRTEFVDEFVKNLLDMMQIEDLELQNKSDNTALILAATAGNLNSAIRMLEKNKAVLDIPGSHGMMPLYVAAFFAQDGMVRYLYNISNKMSGNLWTNENRSMVLQKCVETDIFDVAVKIVNECPQLTTNKRLLTDILLVLAQKTDAFEFEEITHRINRKIDDLILICVHLILKNPITEKIVDSRKFEPFIRETIDSREFGPSIRNIIYSIFHMGMENEALQLLRIIWNKIAIMPYNEIDEILQGPPVEIEEDQQHKIRKTTYPSRVIFIAAEMGNVRFIIELLRSYPDLIWTVDDQGLSIFHIAAKHRQEDVYSLLYDIGSMKDSITIIEDKDGNNMLHMVAKSTANPKGYENVSGDALLIMQRELLWFQEVHSMIPPSYRDKKNSDGETPHEVFTKSHKNLRAMSEKWIKETAPQLLVGATIIATMTFAAAFTAPGGYCQDTGIPMLLHKPAFRVFLIADALSLLLSSSAILVLLSMFTSHYGEHDFLEIPEKLMIGLATLYGSIMTMIIAFTASFFVLYSDTNLKWIPFMVVGIAALVHSVYTYFNFPFLMGLIKSSIDGSTASTSLFNRRKHTLYYEKSL